MVEENQKEGEKGGEEKKKFNYIIIAAVVIAVIVVGLFFISSKNKDKSATISGTVSFNGLKPQDEDKQQVKGKIVLMQREAGQGEFKDAGIEIAFQDEAGWAWHGAQSGKTYEIRMDLSLNDEFIKSSNVAAVTAPASGQNLSIDVTLKDIPEDILSETNVLIAGTFDINGYIPEGSIVAISQKIKGASDDTYVTVSENIVAVDGKDWDWDKATPGKEYDLKAVMTYQGKTIGESQILDVVAPASNEVLIIQSQAKDPNAEKAATISGTVKLSGPVADNSVINLYQRKVGDKNFVKFGHVPAIDNSSFKWTSAIEGVQYQIAAALNVSGEDTSHSNVITATAPAKNEVLKLDTNLSLKSPQDKPTVDCGKKDDTGHWNATLTFKRIEKASVYSLELGSKPGKDDEKQEMKDQTKKSDPTMEIYIKDGSKYYAQYAYSHCADCDLKDYQNWSGYSPTLGFVCGNDSSN